MIIKEHFSSVHYKKRKHLVILPFRNNHFWYSSLFMSNEYKIVYADVRLFLYYIFYLSLYFSNFSSSVFFSAMKCANQIYPSILAGL